MHRCREARFASSRTAETAVWWLEEDPRCTAANVVRDSSRDATQIFILRYCPPVVSSSFPKSETEKKNKLSVIHSTGVRRFKPWSIPSPFYM